MRQLPLQITISPELFIKNPDTTDLGKKIVSESITLIHELGFEDFTIKKLSMAIGSPESTIYRYFDSKQMILTYLISWYWSWVEYRLVFAISNLQTAAEKLRKSIQILTEPVEEDHLSFSHINQKKLDQIIIIDAVKAYSSKQQKSESYKFTVYQRVIERLSLLILQINPTYLYPHMLVSTIIEGAHHQRFFAENIPNLTDVATDSHFITNFYIQLVFTSIEK